MNNKRINVTEPSLPNLKEFIPYLEKIWESKWLTNNGQFHQQLEKELAEYLGVNYISLFANGTLALIVALQSLEITGEVITTPFTFIATSNSLWLNNIKPVFCDIDPNTYNIDPNKIEKLITSKTTAIMPVHVYGYPCENEKIKKIADKYNLKIIYDAAHAFNIKKDKESILNWGDLSILSFHATKVFNTFEGGAIISNNKFLKKQIDYLINFGLVGKTDLIQPGLNAKMNEVQAAFGLLQLKYINKNINKRKKIAEYYSEYLDNIRGITIPPELPDVELNYSYYPILIDKELYGISRDELYNKLKENNIFGRRYFYPLISNFPIYNSLSSSKKENLPIANKIAEQVLCLPIYPDLKMHQLKKIINIMLK